MSLACRSLSGQLNQAGWCATLIAPTRSMSAYTTAGGDGEEGPLAESIRLSDPIPYLPILNMQVMVVSVQALLSLLTLPLLRVMRREAAIRRKAVPPFSLCCLNSPCPGSRRPASRT
jgi:hypothetical protein